MIWILWWYKNYRKPTDHPTLTGAELRHIYNEAADQMGPWVPWIRCSATARPGPSRREISHRSDLVVLSLLAAVLLQREISISTFRTSACRLSLSTTCPRSAASPEAGSPRPFASWSLRCGSAIWRPCALRLSRGARFHHRASEFRVGRYRLCWEWPPAHTRAGRPISSLRFRICFPRTAVGSVTGIGSMAGSVGGFLIAFYTGHVLHARIAIAASSCLLPASIFSRWHS